MVGQHGCDFHNGEPLWRPPQCRRGAHPWRRPSSACGGRVSRAAECRIPCALSQLKVGRGRYDHPDRQRVCSASGRRQILNRDDVNVGTPIPPPRRGVQTKGHLFPKAQTISDTNRTPLWSGFRRGSSAPGVDSLTAAHLRIEELHHTAMLCAPLLASFLERSVRRAHFRRMAQVGNFNVGQARCTSHPPPPPPLPPPPTSLRMGGRRGVGD